MANAQQNDLDFITNHYEQCYVDFQSAIFRYRELLFFPENQLRRNLKLWQSEGKPTHTPRLLLRPDGERMHRICRKQNGIQA